jgi:FkbM family methyltransferase
MKTLIQTEDKGFGSFIVLKEDLIGRYIQNMGFWEIPQHNIYSVILQKTDVVLDAGANIGFHTVGMAKIAKKVYSFEPQPIMYNILTANILFNDLTTKVEQFRLGLGESEATVKLCPLNDYKESDGVDNYGARGIATEEEYGDEEIKIIAFDSLEVDVDAVKMDIQNYELEALKGMVNTLKKCKPWIMIENYIDVEKDKKVLEFLKDLNYEIYRPFKDPLPTEDCICFSTENPKHVNKIDLFNSNHQLKSFYKKL